MPIGVQFRCLMKANDMLLNDIIEKLRCGYDERFKNRKPE